MLSSPGIGSGLDVNGIVSALMNVERNQLSRLEAKNSEISNNISNLGVIKSSLDDLNTTLDALKELKNNNFIDISSSNEELITVTADPETVQAGQYSVTVNQLAQNHKIASKAYSATTDAISEGVLQFSVNGNSFDITIDSSNATLEGLKNAINNAEDNSGINASIISVNDTLGNAEYRLVLTSEQSGADNAISMSDISGSLSTELDISLEITAATDAHLTVDGFDVYRSSNEMNDVIAGVTFTAKAVSAETVLIDASQNEQQRKDDMGALLEEFVTNYNQIFSQVDEVNAGGRDSNFRLIKSNLQNIMGNTSSVSSVFNIPADIGITIQNSTTQVASNGVEYVQTGAIELDSSDLNAAIDNNYDELATFLFDETNGLIANLQGAVNTMLDSNGVFEIKEDSLNDLQDYYDDRIFREQARLETFEETLYQNFSRLDASLAQSNSTSQYLAAQLASIPVINNSPSNNS